MKSFFKPRLQDLHMCNKTDRLVEGSVSVGCLCWQLVYELLLRWSHQILVKQVLEFSVSSRVPSVLNMLKVLSLYNVQTACVKG